MKTKIAKKLPRGKHAKIAFLKRSAAGKAVHHRRRIRQHARIHLWITSAVLACVVASGMAVAAQVPNIIPPAGDSAQVDAYIRAAQAHSAALRAERRAAEVPDQIGAASWYALGLAAPDALTCASRQFPRGTYLRVRDLRNGREVVCLVNDYGPVAGTHRVIDLSRGSYSSLEGLGSGTMPVEIWVTSKP